MSSRQRTKTVTHVVELLSLVQDRTQGYEGNFSTSFTTSLARFFPN